MMRRVASRLAARQRMTVMTSVSDDMLLSLSRQYGAGGAKSHAELVDKLTACGLLRSERDPEPILYGDVAVACGPSSRLCSPSMQVTALEHLQEHIAPGKRALDIGTGTGAIASMMKEMGADVTGLDICPEVIAFASKRDNGVHWVCDNALTWQPVEQFDCIHVGGCVDAVPSAWIEMLANNGCLLVPVGWRNTEQTLLLVSKQEDGWVSRKPLQLCAYEAIRKDSSKDSDWPFSEHDVTTIRAGIKHELSEWQQKFVKQHQRKPTMDDMNSDVRVSEILAIYRKAKHLAYKRPQNTSPTLS
ncbi:unnamed protein product (mitochondrion) [Plasmodiophora brassicae]|uniref:protein-L-isoaspartate(D-aspartate) O-methyltransferase n=1 Tax=Plasmodiophora brassicae TaxID=37360 RepID=A0A3P3Y790_PLABS|nr:unnamed protein product [Plasmodiophora brassicae]